MEDSLSFPKDRRVRDSKRFREVLQNGYIVKTSDFVVRALPNQLPFSRLGIMVNKRCGSAVVRNRLKRLIREAFRLSVKRILVGYDVVVIPRTSLLPSVSELGETLVFLINSLTRRRS